MAEVYREVAAMGLIKGYDPVVVAVALGVIEIELIAAVLTNDRPGFGVNVIGRSLAVRQ